MKKTLKVLNIILLVQILLSTNVYAKTPETYSRTKENNYGINSKIQITKKNKNNILRTPLVNPNEKIYDFSDILTDEEEEELKRQIDEFRDKTNMEIVIVTDSMEYKDDKENEEYADDFYDYNDFGIDENFSGILLFRNTYEYDPYYHMSTTGNAILYYTDYKIDKILDSIYNNISSGNYYLGFSQFISQLDYYYNQGIDSSMAEYTFKNGKLIPPPYKVSWPIVITMSTIVTIIVISILVKKNKMILKAIEADRYLDHKSIIVNKRKDRFLGTRTTSYTVSSSSGGGGGGGSSTHSGSSGSSHGGGGRHG